MNNQLEARRAYTTRRVAKAIAYLGGSCVVCGSTNQLEFDHVDPTTKVLEVTTAIMRECWAWSRLVTELDKCQLLCRDHHEEKTRQGDIPHGGGLSGKRNCPCRPCKGRKAEYMAAYVRPSPRIR